MVTLGHTRRVLGPVADCRTAPVLCQRSREVVEIDLIGRRSLPSLTALPPAGDRRPRGTSGLGEWPEGALRA
jgi:hypothetical protein